MPPPSPARKEYIEVLGSMEKGVNYGIAPNLIPNNQLAAASNLTVRGDFVNPRPKVRKIPITFQSGADIVTGIFQGACAYSPDTGNGSLMAAISGRLFQFTINGAAATGIEQTIAKSLNATTPTQSWLWQSENYVIVNDGVNLPIFFDGSTSRRSYGPAVSLGVASANFIIPPPGQSVSVVLKSNYNGPFNATVLVDDFAYVVQGTGSSYSVILTNISDTPGTVRPSDTALLSEPSVPAVLTQPFTFFAGTYPVRGVFGTMTISPGNSLIVGQVFNPVSAAGSVGPSCFVSAISGTSATINDATGLPQTIIGNLNYAAGTQIVISTSQPNVTTATTAAGFVAPAVNGSVTVQSAAPYSGVDGAAVYIGKAQYLISAGPTTVNPVSNTVNLLNVSDVPGAGGIANVRGPNPAGSGQVLAGPGQMTTIPELPAGRMGAYGMSRNWMCLTDGRSFVAGDIVGGSSGTPALGYRDAVLRITENTFLFEGGVFVIPGSAGGDIRAMAFSATLDASLGQGPLQVFTPTTAFSCNAPVDRATWQAVTNPILTESMISNGFLGQYSTVLANSDVVGRSLDGLRSQILARRDFNVWGNVPQSREVQPTLDADNPALLAFGSAVVFGNRLLTTANPIASPNGVYHPITIATNFEPLSSLNSKQPAVYDGLWTPFNVLQYVVGQFNGVQRCFAFVLNTTANVIELWELLPDASSVTLDNGTAPVVMDFVTGDLFDEQAASQNKTRFEYCQLDAGEISVDQVTGPASFAVYFRPDQYQTWTLWNQWNVGGASSFYPRMGLGTPNPSVFDPKLNRPLREGFTFQIRIVMNNCRLLSARFRALPLAMPEFAPILTPNTP